MTGAGSSSRRNRSRRSAALDQAQIFCQHHLSQVLEQKKRSHKSVKKYWAGTQSNNSSLSATMIMMMMRSLVGWLVGWLDFMAYQPVEVIKCQILFIHIYWKYMICPWCNGYRRRKWIRRHEFKSWTRLIAFHIALIPLRKAWIQLFFLQLWLNIRTDYVLQPW